MASESSVSELEEEDDDDDVGETLSIVVGGVTTL